MCYLQASEYKLSIEIVLPCHYNDTFYGNLYCSQLNFYALGTLEQLVGPGVVLQCRPRVPSAGLLL